MKKIMIGVFGILVLIGGIASLRSGALKAGELNRSAPSIIETETTESTYSVPENNVSSVNEEIVESEGPVIEAERETPMAEPSVSIEQSGNPESTVSSEAPPSEGSTSNTSTNPSTTVPSSSSSSSSSSSNSSGSSSTGTTSSSSSTPKPTQPSTTTPSSTKPSGTTPSSVTPTQPSTSQPTGKPTQPVAPAPVPTVPDSPDAATNVTPNVSSVQANPTFTPTVPEAFSEKSTLNLPSELKATGVAQSDLKGFELPLLSRLKEKAHGALIYEGIKQVGIEQEETYDVKQLVTTLYKELYAIEPSGTPKKMPEELQIGSLLYRKEKDQTVLLGIYIGEDYYLSVNDVEVTEETMDTENKTTSESVTPEKAMKVGTGATKVKKREKTKRVNKRSTEETTLANSEEKETQRQVVVESIDLDEDLLVQEIPEVTLTEYGEEVLKDYPAAMNFTENERAKNFIEKVGEDAQKLGQEYDVFASVMIAQALLESGSGTSGLSLPPNHNLFGVKGSYQGQSISMATQEDRGNGELYSINSAFRKYPNFAASLGDYVELLRGGISGNASYYEKTWRSKAKNYLRTTDALTGTYATDTTYGKKLNSIIALYHLTQYDQVKTTESNSGVFIKGKDEIPEEYRSRMKYPDYNGVDYNASGSYPVGQCTWYAFNRVNQLGKTVDDYMGNGGQWATKGKALGYEVSQKPKAGWLISFKPGVAGSDARYGHVAFVEVVRPEGILISEGNVYGGTIISYRVIDSSLATSDQVSYIKAK
ncbi:glucosaminidase domain-containing protein [Enterococcus sp. AZ196]|uniref:glucosaminidase domain-containing protein n=1 Tax=Enterococcus sp. AZ196 TaxID=2774659 RepID=UPI003D2973E3